MEPPPTQTGAEAHSAASVAVAAQRALHTSLPSSDAASQPLSAAHTCADALPTAGASPACVTAHRGTSVPSGEALTDSFPHRDARPPLQHSPFLSTPPSACTGPAGQRSAPSPSPDVDGRGRVDQSTPPVSGAAAATTSPSAARVVDDATWSSALRQRLFDHVFTPATSPWMSFSSALGWERETRWGDSDDESEDNEGGSASSSNNNSSNNTASGGRGRALGDGGGGGEERAALLHQYSSPRHAPPPPSGLSPSSPGSPHRHGEAALSSRQQQPQQQRRRRWWPQRLQRHVRRHSGWFLFIATLVLLQLTAALSACAGVVVLRARHSDVLLPLSGWGVASCVCGAGISLLTCVLLLSLRKKALLSAVGSVVLLLFFFIALVVLAVVAAWLTWVVWDANSQRSLSYVLPVWEAAVAATRRRAATGEATASSPVCRFQAVHHCSGFRYGCCNASLCFQETDAASSANTAGWEEGAWGTEQRETKGVPPAWATLVCPVCTQGDEPAGSGSSAADSSSSNSSSAADDGFTGAPVVCSMALLPSLLLSTVAAYACLNAAALTCAVTAGGCTRLLHRAVRSRRDALSASRANSHERT